ncbi:MAG: hypothetical protein ACOYZ8_12005 [Chloroflexota bacterium]
MQTKRVPLWTLGLAAVFVIAACAPAVTPPPAAATQPQAEAPTAAPSTPTTAPAIPTVTATSIPAELPLPAATSRGADLEATDPTTVSLAAGQLQLVEFFRFT